MAGFPKVLNVLQRWLIGAGGSSVMFFQPINFQVRSMANPVDEPVGTSTSTSQQNEQSQRRWPEESHEISHGIVKRGHFVELVEGNLRTAPAEKQHLEASMRR